MGDGFLIVLSYVLFIAALAAANFYWVYSRSQTMLERWANEQGYKILHSEVRWLNRGPYSGLSGPKWLGCKTSKGETVRRVRVQDSQGMERSGFVRFGSWGFGLWTPDVDIIWDDQPVSH